MNDQRAGSGIRSSATEREAVADRLTRAEAEGRLSTEELTARLRKIVDTATRGDLAALVADLPEESTVPDMPAFQERNVSPASVPPETHLRLIGGYRREGQWTVPAEIRVISPVGGVRLDFTRAIFTSPTVSILLVSVIGGATVTVPRGVRVQVEGLRLVGGTDYRGADEDFDGRTIRISSWGILGGVSVKRV
jgi:hypothetical protein